MKTSQVPTDSPTLRTVIPSRRGDRSDERSALKIAYE